MHSAVWVWIHWRANSYYELTFKKRKLQGKQPTDKEIETSVKVKTHARQEARFRQTIRGEENWQVDKPVRRCKQTSKDSSQWQQEDKLKHKNEERGSDRRADGEKRQGGRDGQ